MKLLLLLIIFLLTACGKPTAHVYKDNTVQNQDSLKLCLLGNVGQGSLIQRNVVDALQLEKCDQVYLLGDLVSGDIVNSLDDASFLDKFLSYYQPLLDNNFTSKINLILGDSEYAGNPEIWLEISSKHEGFFFPNYYYLVDYGGLCLVALDTNLFTNLEYAAKAVAETSWITQLQDELKGCKLKVAVSHHPYKGDKFPVALLQNWTGPSGALKVFFDTFIIGKFNLLVSAHVNTLNFDGTDENTKLIISGTGGEIKHESDQPGFVVLYWRPDSSSKISYRFKKLATPSLLPSDNSTPLEP